MGSAVQFGVLFLLMGPPIGSFIFVVAAGVLGAAHGSPRDTADLVAEPILLLGLVLLGYLFAGAPAFVAGLLVGAANRWIRGWTLYAVALAAGFLATALPLVVLGSGLSDPLWSGGLGAVVALACTGAARRCGLGV